MSTTSVAKMACLKTLLMIFNFAFSLSGTAILFIGLWMYFRMSTVLEFSAFNSSVVFYILVATGAVTVVAGILACCFTAKTHAGFLYTYGVLLFLIMVLEISEGIFIAIYNKNLAEGFDKGLNQSIINYNPDSLNSRDLDLLQSTLHCCGNHNFMDWILFDHVVPDSCCKVPKCNPLNPLEIYTQGCYDTVINFINSHMEVVAGAAVGLALFPLIGVILSCCLAKAIKKANYQPMD